MTDARFNIELEGNVFAAIKQLQQQFASMEVTVDRLEKNTSSSFGKIGSALSQIKLSALHQNLQNLNQGFQDLNAPGMQFNQSLQDLSALTGTTGKDLDKLGELARKSAKEFGGNAAASIESYKTILGRLGPDIAKNQGALAGMERNVQILSKTMGGDSAGAVDALTTAMLQFGVDLSNPIQAQKEMTKMMDVMANSAQAGAAEVPSISAALKVSGVAATQAKVSFAETNAAIQALAQGGKEGSEAGVALRNILGKMAGEDVLPKEAAEKLKKLGVDMRVVSDTSIPFTDRLRELKKAQGDATIMAQVFGTENAAAAQILLQSVDAQDKMTGEIQKSGGAQKQANVVMESTAEKLARMRAWIDDVKLGFFEATGGVTAYLEPFAQLATTFSAFSPLLSGASKLFISFKNTQFAGAIATKVVTAAQWLWNVALNANPIGLVIAAVAALGVAVYALSKAFDQSTDSERINAEVKSRALDKTIEQKSELGILFDRLRQAKKGTDEYNSALKDLEGTYPGIIDKYNLQKGNLADINAAHRELIANIDAVAQQEARKEILKENYKKKFENEEKMRTGDYSAMDLIKSGITGRNSILDENISIARENQVLQKQIASNEIKTAKSKSKLDGYSKSENEPISDAKSGKDFNAKSKPLVSPTGTSDKKYSGTGGELKNINVRIENLVKELVIQTSNITESAGMIKDKITEAMVGAVRDFEVAM